MGMDWLRVVGMAVAFVVVFGTGFRMKRSGSPYGTAVLTMHKLISVGMLVFVAWSAYSANRMSPLGALVWGVVSLAFLAFLAMIASGGVLSAVNTPPAAVSRLHEVAPYATALLTAATFYCLARGAA